MSFLLVYAHMASPLAGNPPMLDSIVEYEMAMKQGYEYKLQRHEPAPVYGEVPIPIMRRRIGGLLIPCCSSPIVSPEVETVEYFAKRFSAENADLVIEKKRRNVTVGSGALKSYRLPLRIRVVDRVAWYIEADRKRLRGVLRRIDSIGKKRSQGYGRVSKWTVGRIDDNNCWFAETQDGLVLMRPLPDCSKLPKDLIGVCADFGSVQSPYWHPDRFIERVVPC